MSFVGIVNYHPSVKSSQPIVNVVCNEQHKESVSCESGASTQLSARNHKARILLLPLRRYNQLSPVEN